jgi:hypothetical protein
LKTVMIAAAAMTLVSAAFVASPANAAGCLKGAMVGGTAGHFAGHHGWIGAGVGCVVGRHQANKHARQQMNDNGWYGSSTYSSSTGPR